jgi:hypothetical protein
MGRRWAVPRLPAVLLALLLALGVPPAGAHQHAARPLAGTAAPASSTAPLLAALPPAPGLWTLRAADAPTAGPAQPAAILGTAARSAAGIGRPARTAGHALHPAAAAGAPRGRSPPRRHVPA